MLYLPKGTAEAFRQKHPPPAGGNTIIRGGNDYEENQEAAGAGPGPDAVPQLHGDARDGERYIPQVSCLSG